MHLQLWTFVLTATSYTLGASNPSPALMQDSLTFGPPLTLEHLFENQWPTGIGVSSSGTMYVNFPITVNTTNAQFTLGVVTNLTSEAPFPSLALNTPPGGFVDAQNPAYGAGDAEHLVSVQSVVVDAKDRVWALDTGRPMVGATVLLASPGGPKLWGFDESGRTAKKIVLPQTVAFPDSYLNDVRFDLRPNITQAGEGVAYITDSSNEGRNGIIVVDLGTGDAWRHVSEVPETRADPAFVSTYDGKVFVPVTQGTGVNAHLTTGSDGIALSNDGEFLYFSPLASRRFYRVPTALLRVKPSALHPDAADAARRGVQALGLLGGSHADGFETDASGAIYIGAPEQDGISVFRPDSGVLAPFVRDARIQWPDTFSVASERLFFTSNQYWRQPALNNGTDMRVKPFQVWSVPIGAGKVMLV